MIVASTIFVIVGIYSTLAVLVIVTSLLYDIRIIRLNRAAKQHPYAAWRRTRPQTAIVIHESHAAHSEVTTKSIMANRYTHKKIVGSSQLSSVDTPFIVRVQAGDIFYDTMLRESIQYMLYFKSHTYDIRPALSNATTAGAVIKNYLIIVDQLFSKMRTVLTVTKSRSITTDEINGRKHMTTLYIYAALFIATITSYVILASTYLAVAVNQPTLLLGITLFFSLSLLIAITSEERLTLKEKVLYCVLAPISFPVFYTIGILGPLFRVGSLLRPQGLFKSFDVYSRN